MNPSVWAMMRTLFTGQTSKEGFYMKYDYGFKLKCVELYKNGRWHETPEGIGQKNFRKGITTWVKIADLHGIDALKHPTTCTEYTVEERYALVARVLAGESQKSVAISANINHSQLSNWVKRYKIYGYNGLDLKKGRHSKEQPLKKSIISSELTPPEKEELIRLRAAIVKEIREKGYRLKHLLKA